MCVCAWAVWRPLELTSVFAGCHDTRIQQHCRVYGPISPSFPERGTFAACMLNGKGKAGHTWTHETKCFNLDDQDFFSSNCHLNSEPRAIVVSSSPDRLHGLPGNISRFFFPFLNFLSLKFHLKCLCFAQFEIALENNTWCCLRAEKYFEELEPASVCVCARAHSIKMADCRRFDKYFVPFSYPSLPSFWVISRYADWLQCTSFRSNLWCQNFIHSHWGFFLFILV